VLRTFFHALGPFLRPRAGVLALVGLVLLAEIAFNAALPFSFKFIVDDAILKNDGRLLALIIAGLAVAAIAVSLLGLLRDWLYAKAMAQTVAAIRFRMYSHLQNQSLGYFSRSQSGDLLARFSGDLNVVETALASAVAWAVIPLLDVISHSILLAVLDWRLALLALLVCPIIVLGPRVFTPRASRASTERREMEGGVLARIQENLAAQPVVQALTLQQRLIAQFSQHNDALADSTRRGSYLGSLVERSAGSGILLMQVAITGIGAWRVYAGHMSLGELVAFQALFVTLSYSLMYVAQYIPNLIQAAGGMARVSEILGEPSQVQDAPDARTLPRFAQEIRFEGVRFGYREGARNLDQVSLGIRRGQSVAFVGPSGSGKSTIVNLLMRFFDPGQGAVRYDGHDIRTVTQESLRANIGLVFQESFLFNIALRENIRLGRPDATDAQVEQAARGAEIHDFIMGLPQGYDTPAGERGGYLSGGQRQRIGIARALLRDPPILILDEATSALDPATEAAIGATLQRIARDRTVISVTHRLGSVTGCDCIFVMEQGRVAQSGTHAQLLAQGGLYASLVSKQHGISISAESHEATIAPEKLRSIPILQDLPDTLLEKLVSQFGQEEVPAGRLVFQQGDAGDRFYLLAHGSVEVLGAGPGPGARIAVLQDGDYFGELALLNNSPRNASVRTLSHCLMLTLPRTQFRHLIAHAPDLQQRLLRRYEKST
jgi:ATP-binding cassette subfamily B protein